MADAGSAAPEHAVPGDREHRQVPARVLRTGYRPAQAAGAIRPLVKAGWAGSSQDDKNTTIYWLTEEGKKNKKKEENK